MLYLSCMNETCDCYNFLCFFSLLSASTVHSGPIGGQTKVTVPNENLQYIVMWHSMSLATFYVFWRFWRKGGIPKWQFMFMYFVCLLVKKTFFGEKKQIKGRGNTCLGGWSFWCILVLQLQFSGRVSLCDLYSSLTVNYYPTTVVFTRLLSSTPRSPNNGGGQAKKLFLLIIPVSTFGLGTWQVFRLRWKRRLIADLEKRTMEKPVAIPIELVMQ